MAGACSCTVEQVTQTRHSLRACNGSARISSSRMQRIDPRALLRRTRQCKGASCSMCECAQTASRRKAQGAHLEQRAQHSWQRRLTSLIHKAYVKEAPCQQRMPRTQRCDAHLHSSTSVRLAALGAATCLKQQQHSSRTCKNVYTRMRLQRLQACHAGVLAEWICLGLQHKKSSVTEDAPLGHARADAAGLPRWCLGSADPPAHAHAHALQQSPAVPA